MAPGGSLKIEVKEFIPMGHVVKTKEQFPDLDDIDDEPKKKSKNKGKGKKQE